MRKFYRLSCYAYVVDQVSAGSRDFVPRMDLQGNFMLLSSWDECFQRAREEAIGSPQTRSC